MRYIVVDSLDAQVGETLPILGRFDSEQEASEFIETLPDFLSGRYGLDPEGPAED
jgi:hypothetical protein